MKNGRKKVSPLFFPRSVVVVGVSRNPVKSGSRIVQNLVMNGFPGPIYCVNPSGGETTIAGKNFTLFRSVAELPHGACDLAIIFVRNEFIPGVIRQCIEKGIGYAIIEAAGFDEIGTGGEMFRRQLEEITEGFTKMRVVGPNCTGVTVITGEGRGFFSSFVPMTRYRPGIVSIISQSGMLNGGYFLYLNTSTNIGFRNVVALGNKIDVDENEVLAYYLNDDNTRIIAMYLESISDARGLIELGRRARENGKHVFLLKSGVSEAGKAATQSHTASLGEDARLVDAIARQGHMITCESFHEMFQLVKCLDYALESKVNLPPRGIGRVAILTVTGGAACVATDLVEKNPHLCMARLGVSSKGLKKLYPDWMPVPEIGVVDLWPAVEHHGDSSLVFKKAFEIVMADDDIDIVLMTYFVGKDYPFDHQVVIDARNHGKKPVIVWMFGDGEHVQHVKKIMEKNLVPVYENLALATRAMACLCR